MNQGFKISIIIPTYNSLHNLKKAIHSIVIQDYLNYEIVIVDAISNDGTKQYLQSLNQKIVWISEKDNGIYDAMNKGVKLSSGDLLLFLGSDDVLHSSCVLSQINDSFDTTIDVLFGKIQYDFNKDTSVFVKRNQGVFKARWDASIWFKNPVHHQATIYKRKILEKHPFSTHYFTIADYRLNIIMYLKKYSFKIVPLFVAQCSVGGVSQQLDKKIYTDEVAMKREFLPAVFFPLLYLIVMTKYYLKKLIVEKRL